MRASPAIAALHLAADVRNHLVEARTTGSWRGVEELRSALRDLLAAATSLSWIDADPGSAGAVAGSLGFDWYEDDARFVWADAERAGGSWYLGTR